MKIKYKNKSNNFLLMQACICGSSSNFSYVLNNDFGFDHNSYKPCVNLKKYRICNTCLSIKREDNEILNPFYSEYSHSTENCITASNRLHRISNFIIENIEDKDIKNLCDFGGGDGELLLLLKNKFQIASLNVIEIMKEGINKKINYYSSLKEVLMDKNIDVFIASNSLCYTDYSELFNLLSNREISPKYIIFAGSDFINRPSQLFYDDVTYNASRKGIKLFLQRCGYEFKESELYDVNNKEYLILGIKKKEPVNQNIIPQKYNKININLLKNEIINLYKVQANLVNKEKKITIFGTSIDSAILSCFINSEFNFTKDSISKGEKFMGKEIITLETLESSKGKLLIPKLIEKTQLIIDRIINSYNIDLV